jgi:hypothetical protein
MKTMRRTLALSKIERPKGMSEKKLVRQLNYWGVELVESNYGVCFVDADRAMKALKKPIPGPLTRLLKYLYDSF